MGKYIGIALAVAAGILIAFNIGSAVAGLAATAGALWGLVAEYWGPIVFLIVFMGVWGMVDDARIRRAGMKRK